jgi:REP element-mobilizing transposase RayT
LNNATNKIKTLLKIFPDFSNFKIRKELVFYDQALIFQVLHKNEDYVFYYVEEEDGDLPTENYLVFKVNDNKIDNLMRQDLKIWIKSFKKCFLIRIKYDQTQLSINQIKTKDIPDKHLPEDNCYLNLDEC